MPDFPHQPSTSVAPLYIATRHDGWTAARQAHFLRCLARGVSVTAACAAVGKSAASAYRLRHRADAAAFAAAWDACLIPRFAFRSDLAQSPSQGGEGAEGGKSHDRAAPRQFHHHRERTQREIFTRPVTPSTPAGKDGPKPRPGGRG